MNRSGRDALRTHVSIQAVDLAASFNAAMSKLHMMPGDYAPELTAPEGPSTAGGVLAMQRLRLVPRQPGYPTIVAGSANHTEGHAELRSWDYIDSQNRERFKRPLALDRAQYEQFLEMARNVLSVMRLNVTIAMTPPRGSMDSFTGDTGAAPPAGVSSTVKLVVGIGVFVFALMVLAAVGYWLFVVRGM